MDQCTHDARYSLSEDRLLREAVAAGVVRCCVVQDELEEDVVVRVLDCDSISQVRYIFIIYISLSPCKDVNGGPLEPFYCVDFVFFGNTHDFNIQASSYLWSVAELCHAPYGQSAPHCVGLQFCAK